MKLTVRNTCSDGPGSRDWFETRDFEVQVTDEMVARCRAWFVKKFGTGHGIDGDCGKVTPCPKRRKGDAP